jgi:hypothetical protein
MHLIQACSNCTYVRKENGREVQAGQLLIKSASIQHNTAYAIRTCLLSHPNHRQTCSPPFPTDLSLRIPWTSPNATLQFLPQADHVTSRYVGRGSVSSSTKRHYSFLRSFANMEASYIQQKEGEEEGSETRASAMQRGGERIRKQSLKTGE